MSGSPSTILSLRRLIAEKFPVANRPQAGLCPTGSRSVDEALGGGLRTGCLTEIVSQGPSRGGQSVLVRLLEETRAGRSRVALVDGSDAFDPSMIAPDCLRHLVWVRCQNSSQALSAADILVRDGNYALVVCDLRGLSEHSLRRTPQTVWHRLQRAVEMGGAAVLVQTDFPLIPTAQVRLVLEGKLTLASAVLPQADIASAVEPARARGSRFAEELTG